MSHAFSVGDVIEASKAQCIALLAEAVAIKSVSGSPECRPHVREMAQWIRKELIDICPDALVDLVELEGHTGLPPLVMARMGPSKPNKKTLLVYAHYDVQPAAIEDGWDSDPFVLTAKDNGELVGRGSTDDKGPLIGWLCMMKAYKDAKQELPVNLRFIMEGMEESGSIGFDETVIALSKKTDFFENVDFVCISDNYWLGTTKPCVTYGLRGLVSCEMSIEGPSKDLHSGSFGGQVFQPMDDLIALLSSLKAEDETILIPGVTDDVTPVMEAEVKMYEKIHFDQEGRKADLGVSKLRHSDHPVMQLMSIWRFPSLTIHGIEGAFSDKGFKTVIPCHVTGKFSIRTVPNMDGPKVMGQVKDFLEAKFAERKSPNKMTLHLHYGRWWYVDPNESPVYKAAIAATETVYKQTPDLTREGGSIPITLTLTELTGKDVCLLPMGRGNDGAHSQNEKLDESNFITGIKLYCDFLEKLAQ